MVHQGRWVLPANHPRTEQQWETSQEDLLWPVFLQRVQGSETPGLASERSAAHAVPSVKKKHADHQSTQCHWRFLPGSACLQPLLQSCHFSGSLSPQAPHSLWQCWSHCFSLELCKEPRCGAQAISSLPAKALKRCLTATFPKPVHTAAMCFLNCLLFFLLCCVLKLCFKCVWLFHFHPSNVLCRVPAYLIQGSHVHLLQ